VRRQIRPVGLDPLGEVAAQRLARPGDPRREEQARVAARRSQRGAGQGGEELVEGAGRLGLDHLERLAQRRRHVGAGVVVGDGEDVERVDRVAVALEHRGDVPHAIDHCCDHPRGRPARRTGTFDADSAARSVVRVHDRTCSSRRVHPL
jgi:hypothetical protein